MYILMMSSLRQSLRCCLKSLFLFHSLKVGVEISIMEELNFFLELQIQHTLKGTPSCPEKHINEIFKWRNIFEVKTMIKRDSVIMKLCEKDDQVDDIFTEALSTDKSNSLIGSQLHRRRQHNIQGSLMSDQRKNLVPVQGSC